VFDASIDAKKKCADFTCEGSCWLKISNDLNVSESFLNIALLLPNRYLGKKSL